MRKALRVAALTVLPLLLASCGGREGAPGGTGTIEKPAPIKVGVYGSLTGTTATFGQSTKKGVELAVEEINSAGGVKGRTIQMIVEDDQGRPEEAAAVVQKMIDQDRVTAVLGEVASSRSLAGADPCQRSGIPMITPSSTNPQVTRKGDYIFRMCYTDDFQGATMARFAREVLKANTAAILRDVKNDYSVGLAEYFTKTFTSLGGKVVEDVAYSEGDKDFKGQLTKIRSSRPDIIFIPGYYTEAGLIAQQARELGIRQTLVGGDGWESPKLLEIGGAALEGSYYGNHYFAGAPIDRIRSFVERYQAKYGEEPDSMAALAYDSMKLLAHAMEQSATIAPKEIRDILAATRGYESVTGTITFDEFRNPIKPIAILKVEGGKIAFAQEVGGEVPEAAPSGPSTSPPGS